MKKNCSNHWLDLKNIWASKTFRSMRLTFYVLLLATLQGLASNAYSQTTRLNLNMKNATVREVLSTIEDQSEFYFLFNSKIVEVDREVSVNLKNRKIDEVLDFLFEGTNVTYTIVDRQIVLSVDKQQDVDSQQQKSVVGKVTDKGGQPLPGVTVIEKGTTNGTVTNIDGDYTLSNLPAGATLQFSFVGMKSQEIVVNSQARINVVLEEETIGLEEVVAIGYATQKRSSVTSSISSVSTDEIKDIPVSNTATALQGKLPGVIVQQTTGKPGNTPALKVRGFGSISAGNDPLIVVDGNIVNSSVFSTLSQDEIASIDVLKDASSTAIYGSRGSNGVIMVTTKRGKKGKTVINLNVYSGIQQITKKMDLLNSQQFAEFSREAYNTAYTERIEGASAGDPNSVRPQPADRMRYPQGDVYDWLNFNDSQMVANLPYHDFQDLIFRSAPLSNYQVSASGGNDNVQFLVSGNYMKQKGIMEKSSMDKYAFRTNIDVTVNPKFRLGLDFNPSYIDRSDVKSDGHWASNGVINAALSSVPFAPIYSSDGTTYSSQAELAPAYGWPGVTNPLANITEYDDNSKILRFLGNIYAEYDVLPELKYRISGNVSVNNTRQNTYRTSQMPLNQLLPPNQATGSAISFMDISWLFNQTLNYSKTFNEDHTISVLLGMEATKYTYEYSSVTAINFANDNVRTLNYGTVNEGTSNKTQNSVASYFSRINYDYKNKYLINMSVRRDGSSLFGQDNRWGTFPAGSIGWRVTEEPFMKDFSFLSETKVRVSYGLAGNNAFSTNYPYVGLLETNNYAFGDELSNGLAASTLGNSELGWEKSKQADIGVDLGFLKNRIYFIADYYERKTTDLLLSVNVPTITGFSSTVKNIGKMKNNGWEFALTTKNLTGQFTWNTNMNLSFNRNEVLALGPTGDPIRSGSGVGETNITVIGEPIGSFYGYKQIGIFRDEADLNSYPHFSDTRPGDVKYEDVNGDKKIDANDRTIIGNNQPDFIYGITNTFSYKGFDLNIVFTGVHGGDILNLSRRFYENLEGSQNQLTTVLNRWHSPEDPGDGKTPRGNSRTTGNSNSISSRWIEDGSYLRLQNVTLGYQIPQSLLDKAKIQSARIYLSGQNLITWTDYLGYNPEVSGYEKSLTGGVDYGSYPVARTITIGLNLSF